MTKDELLDFLATDEVKEELAAVEIPQEQVDLVIGMYENHANRIAHYANRFMRVKDKLWADEEPYYEAYRRLFFLLDMDFGNLDIATADMRIIQLRQVRQWAALQHPEMMALLKESYPHFTPLSMKYGLYLAEWARAMELDGIFPEGIWAKTIYFFVAIEVIGLTDTTFSALSSEEAASGFLFADSFIGANKTYNWIENGKEVEAMYDNKDFEYIKQVKETGTTLDALDEKFQSLTKERDELERRLNRNREIAAAIWKLQTMSDKDFGFRFKYQWIGVYEVMCEQRLLSDDEKSTFCRICNSPDSPDYFLPENEDELPNAYVPGDAADKESTWHQLSSHGDTPRQRQIIEKTKKEFTLLLKEQGVI